ncbi:MAG: sugar isomerase, partial [Haloechinothrix sp.]
GPMSITDDRSVVWSLGVPPAGLADEVSRAGGLWVESSLDPLAELIRIQRLAVALADRAGLDPDHPRNLTRSIILDHV